MAIEKIGVINYKDRTYLIKYDIGLSDCYGSGKEFNVKFYIERQSKKYTHAYSTVMVLNGKGELKWFEPDITIPLLKDLVLTEIQKCAADLIYLHGKYVRNFLKPFEFVNSHYMDNINNIEHLWLLRILKSNIGDKRKRAIIINYFIDQCYQPLIKRNVENILRKRGRYNIFGLDDNDPYNYS